MYFDFRLYRLWKTRQHSKLMDYEDLLWPRDSESVGPSRRSSPAPCETSHPTSSHEREQELDIMPLESESRLSCIPSLHSRPWAVRMADGQRREGTCAKDSISCQSKQSEISPWWQRRRMEDDCSVFSMSHIYYMKAHYLLKSIVFILKKKRSHVQRQAVFRTFFFLKIQLRHEGKKPILVIYRCAYILVIYYVAIVMQIIQMSVVHNLYEDVYCCGLFNDVLWITQVSAINEYVH